LQLSRGIINEKFKKEIQEKDRGMLMLKPTKHIVGSKKQHLLIAQLQARERELLTQLRNKHTLNMQILDALPFTIFLEDSEGRVKFANKHASDHFGVTIEQMAGRTKYDLFTPLVGERIKQDDQEVWRVNTLVTKEEVIEYKGKSSYVFTGKKIIHAEEESKPNENLLLGFSIDITARVQVEQKLRASEEKFRKLVDQAADSFFLIDMKGHIIDVNTQACKVLGYTQEHLLTMHFERICALPATERQELINKVAGGQTANFEDQMILGNGTRIPVDINLGLIRMGDEEMFLALVRDITDRIKETEEEKRHTHQLLLNSEKLSVVGQLAAGIAHEIRNPLTVVKGFLKLMEREWNQKTYYFQLLNSEIDRMELIVNELLILSKPQAQEYYDKNLRVVLEQVITLLEPQAHLKNVEIHAKFYADGPVFIRCDENQMKQIFINFIKNGIESMEYGGEILVNVSKKSDDHHGGIWITIIDHGCGISEDQLKKLGEPFYSTKERGTGLGFMVSKKIIASHDGTLKVTSKVNEGTTIEIFLPDRCS
jgi:PAS domain S-box-containing protein